MRIGRRDQLVKLERATVTQDAYNEDVESWGTIGQEWAAVFYGQGSERRQAAMEQGQQAATFNMLSNPVTQGLRLTDRIAHAGAAWDIEGIAVDTPCRGEIEVTAVRRT
ncbi:head-tail adaptor protein [Qipengyuania sp. 6B39]|uniref:phage head completion protein n=1 Tax=Qipengyuania proteolytica TaxID=2867239 RepID=UPI001C8AD4AA|nr:head-tail adaptor protein [Qipengyuania proteolytica]MBX7496766.1 head-tail adaptor protein [Qipengyuania proteolytica]